MNTVRAKQSRSYLGRVSTLKHLLKTAKLTFRRPRYAFFGSFDPFTLGHLEVYKRASDQLQADIDIVIVKSMFKENPALTLSQREKVIKSYLQDAHVYFARDYHEIKRVKNCVQVIIKGARDQTDRDHTNFVFKYYDISQKKLLQVEAEDHFRHISSRRLKQLIVAGKKHEASKLANGSAIKALEQRLTEKGSLSGD